MATDSVSADRLRGVLRALAPPRPGRPLPGGRARRSWASLGAGSGLALRLLSEGEPADWFGEGIEPSAVAEAAAAEALADLEARFGADPAGWRWGIAHAVSFRHPLDGRPGTDGLFATAPRETPGTGYVLNANGFSHDAPFAVTSGPEYRLVVDLGDLDATTTVLTTGSLWPAGLAALRRHGRPVGEGGVPAAAAQPGRRGGREDRRDPPGSLILANPAPSPSGRGLG